MASARLLFELLQQAARLSQGFSTCPSASAKLSAAEERAACSIWILMSSSVITLHARMLSELLIGLYCFPAHWIINRRTLFALPAISMRRWKARSSSLQAAPFLDSALHQMSAHGRMLRFVSVVLVMGSPRAVGVRLAYLSIGSDIAKLLDLCASSAGSPANDARQVRRRATPPLAIWSSSCWQACSYRLESADVAAKQCVYLQIAPNSKANI